MQPALTTPFKHDNHRNAPVTGTLHGPQAKLTASGRPVQRQLALFGREHPPTWHALISVLRVMNAAYDGPGPVSLNVHGLPAPSDDCDGPLYGREELPGDGRPFDAPAAARRLLAALKAGERS